MPARSRDRARRALAAAALALWLPGCTAGYLAAAGRRREYVREVHAVTRDAAGTRIRYTADVVDDHGRSRGTVERTRRLPRGDEPPDLRRLTRIRTEWWVYPLLPLALAADVVVFPTLVLMSPAILLVGD